MAMRRPTYVSWQVKESPQVNSSNEDEYENLLNAFNELFDEHASTIQELKALKKEHESLNNSFNILNSVNEDLMGINEDFHLQKQRFNK